ncbi:MAG: nickel pincer cofactor biosynthesis protein LarC [Acidobacteriota bacterium]|nr:nickel pincer cofactor biosynthesis protein LarC [Acidobacteriota bacterium]
MTHVYLDAFAGLSGDMMLGALLDLGVSRAKFRKAVASLDLPIRLVIHDVERSHLRGLKVDVLIASPGSPARRFADVERFLRRAPLAPAVRERSRAVFETLFRAEAKVHGEPFDRVHLHEAGADDALADVVGTCWLLDELGVTDLACSPLNVGSGWVKTSHGVLPVPPPAVAELLRGLPVYAAHAEAELVTPTGAALVKTLASRFVPFPELTYDRIGCGAGGRDLPGLPNVLRAFGGSRPVLDPGRRVYRIEATIDDSTPQVLAAFLDRALELGALDAFLAPVVMKKGRLGTQLTLLADAARLDRLIQAVFEETSSIGVRYHAVERRTLERTMEKAALLGASIRIKTARMGGRVVNAQPEYDDCLALARRKGLPLRDVQRLAAAAHALRK